MGASGQGIPMRCWTHSWSLRPSIIRSLIVLSRGKKNVMNFGRRSWGQPARKALFAQAVGRITPARAFAQHSLIVWSKHSRSATLVTWQPGSWRSDVLAIKSSTAGSAARVMRGFGRGLASKSRNRFSRMRVIP
jgi:hypothetical protein